MSDTLAQAITQLEGSNPIYNNPGDISGTGDTGTSFGSNIGIYSTLDAGQAALQNQLNLIQSGGSAYYDPDETLADFASTYSGGNPNYASGLSSLTGYPTSTPISQVISGDPYSGTATNGGDESMNGSTIDSTPLTSIPGILASKASSSILGGRSLEDVVVIVVGLILIAAGVFAFKTSQSIIEVAGHAASRASELAA